MSDIKERLHDASFKDDQRGFLSAARIMEEAAKHIATLEADIAELKLDAEIRENRITDLEASVAANQKDAERYLWLKDNADVVLHKEAKFSCDFERYSVFGVMPCSAEIDCAIDYGMSDTSTQEVG